MPLAVLAPGPSSLAPAILFRILLVLQATFLAYSGLESADREAAPGANPFAVSPVLEFTAEGSSRDCAWGCHIPVRARATKYTSPSSERTVGLSPAARLTLEPSVTQHEVTSDLG